MSHLIATALTKWTFLHRFRKTNERLWNADPSFSRFHTASAKSRRSAFIQLAIAAILATHMGWILEAKKARQLLCRA